MDAEHKVTHIDYHVSENGWCDGVDLSETDEAASFQAWLQAIRDALVKEYPDAEINVYSQPGQLQNGLRIGVEGEDSLDDDVRMAAWQEADAVVQAIQFYTLDDLWSRGEFWVPKAKGA